MHIRHLAPASGMRREVLDKDGDAPIGRILRGAGDAQMLVGVTPDLGYLVCAQTILLH